MINKDMAILDIIKSIIPSKKSLTSLSIFGLSFYQICHQDYAGALSSALTALTAFGVLHLNESQNELKEENRQLKRMMQ